MLYQRTEYGLFFMAVGWHIFFLRNFDKFDPNQTIPVAETNAVETSKLSAVNIDHNSRSAKTVST